MLCKTCNKEFKPKDNESKYCCRQCYLQDHKRKTVVSICLTCGKEFVVGRDSKGKYCSKECLFLYQSEVAAMCRELKQEIKELNKEANKLKTMMYKSLLKEINHLSNKTQTCEVCGNTFITNHLKRKYCSRKCNNKVVNARKDKRIYKNGTPDLSITLPKLYQRDNGVCNVCGIVCDWQDINVREDGVMIAGDTYPSIDHIIPIAKGGKHEWSNVQLLCRHCNTIKRDT